MNNDEFFIAVKDIFETSMDKMEKKLDATFKEMKRHNDMLFEDLCKDVKLLAEGHSVLNDRMDRLENKFDGFETKFDRLDIKMDRLCADVSMVKEHIINIDRKLNECEVI